MSENMVMEERQSIWFEHLKEWTRIDGQSELCNGWQNNISEKGHG